MTAGWETRDGRADMTNFEMDLFDTRMTYQADKEDYDDDDCCKDSIIKPACLPITILALLLLMTFFFPLFNDGGPDLDYERSGICIDQCTLKIVESIPEGMVFNKKQIHSSTFNAWMNLLINAKESIDLSVLYWNLLSSNNTLNFSWEGNRIFNEIINASKRGVKIRIAQNAPSEEFPQTESEILAKNGIAEVRNVNFTKLFGAGVLHTKMWIIDQKDVYIGSANMDWKSLSEILEIGVSIRNCSCIALDVSKIFTIYWRLGKDAKIPFRWPTNLRTSFNFKRPLKIEFNSVKYKTFLSNSPIEFNPRGREYDLNAIVNVMNSATEYVRVAVMDYLPTTLYMESNKNRFWPNIDNAIRSAAYRGLHVQLLISQWNHSKRETIPYLKSLLQINDATRDGQIDIKLFTVPANKDQKKLRYARVNHNKFMVTENAAYVGTSNWVGDYFLDTAGIGFVLQSYNGSQYLIEDFNEIFLRDWNSNYSSPLTL